MVEGMVLPKFNIIWDCSFLIGADCSFYTITYRKAGGIYDYGDEECNKGCSVKGQDNM